MEMRRRVLKFAPISSIADIQRCFEFRTNVEARAAHLAIVEAISDKDGERAEAAMRAHIDNARHRMFEGSH